MTFDAEASLPARGSVPAHGDFVAGDPSVAHPVVPLDITTALPAESLRQRRHHRSWISTAVERPLLLGFLGAIGAVGGIVLAIALGSISVVVIDIVLALFVALTLDPVVARLERHRISRGLGIAIVFGGFALVLLAFGIFVVPPVIGQIVALLKSVPAHLEAMQESNWYLGLSEHARVGVDSGLSQLADTLNDPHTMMAIGGGVLDAGVGLASFISTALIVVALTLYFLASLTAMKNAFCALAPARNRARIRDFVDRITSSVGSSVMGTVILSALNASFVLLLHLLVGLPFPALMSVVAFVITLIPLFGSVMFLIFGSAVALFSSPTQAVIFAVAYLVYIQVESYVLSPRIMNRAISIPAALVLIGALAGGALMGVLGVLVALPTIASVMLIIREVVVPRQDLKL